MNQNKGLIPAQAGIQWRICATQHEVLLDPDFRRDEADGFYESRT